MNRGRLMRVIFPLLVIFFMSGCTIIVQKGRRSDIEKIKSLQQQLNELRNAKEILEQRLAKEIANKEVTVSMQKKGLVINFVAEVLFDSGKAKLKRESLPILNKVARVLKEEVPGNDVGIEGHTDNEPIRYSGWKSNWELSAHRALSVLHYLISRGVDPRHLRAIAYGEYHPVAPNDTPEHKQLNRRVEIVIMPKLMKKEPVSVTEEGGYKEELK